MTWDPALGHVLGIREDGSAFCSCGVEGEPYVVGLHGQSVLETQFSDALRQMPHGVKLRKEK